MDNVADSVHVDVTILRANNLPRLQTLLGKKRNVYVAVTVGTATRRTKSIRHQGQAVSWNERLDTLVVPKSSYMKLSIYAEHSTSKDELIGFLDIRMESKTQASFMIGSDSAPLLTVVLTSDIRDPIQSTRQAIDNADQAVAGMHVLNEWEATVDNAKWVMDTVSHFAEISPYADLGWKAMCLVPKFLFTQFENDANIRTLVEAMRSTFNLSQAENLLKAIQPNSSQALILKVMLRHLKICSDVILRYADDKEFLKRLMKNITGQVGREIEGLCETLAKLRQDLLDNSVITIQIAVAWIQESTKILPKQIFDIDVESKLRDLPYKSGWRATATIDKNGCLPGTRREFLAHIIDWVSNPSSKIVFALLGQAGTGKSTIAHEIALHFRLEDRLGSYFSFSRNEKSKNEDHHLFTTIIRDLADRYPSFKRALGTLITDNTSLRTTADHEQLFNNLLLEPLQETEDITDTILIVIDALDESGQPTGKRGLASFLARRLSRLPSNFRVLITSRLDGDIRDSFAHAYKDPFDIVEMNDPKLAKTEEDIRFYLQDPHNLSANLFREYGDAMAKRAEGLFQWVAVACGHINNPPPGWTERDCLRGLLNRAASDKEYAQQLHRPLYELYDEVLVGHFNSDIARRRFRSVMSHLLGAAEPLSINSLTLLRQFTPFPDEPGDGAVLAIVKHLGSLLSNVGPENHDLPIIPLHTSFRDYLTEGLGKEDSFSVDLENAHTEMTHACLGIMLRELKFNICGLESSYIPNSKVPDLEARISKCIHPALFYACRFWDDHLEHLTFDEILFHKLRQLFKEKLLFWLEVLSVTDSVPLAVQAFSVLTTWLHSGIIRKAVEDTWKAFDALVIEAYQFLRYFGMPVAESAPHTYISALPFTPTSSEVYKIYSHTFPNTIAFQSGQQVNWPALEMTIRTGDVCSVAFSPDGQYFVTAAEDCDEEPELRLWNATTGQMEGSPFSGHTDLVNSVAFSPDGKWIASGSDDESVILWNASTGQPEKRLERIGYTGSVNSVAFSPDGGTIISGSWENTICFWNVSTGELELDPSAEHTDVVTSVAFSPNGKTAVSGSQDKTLCLWNAATGELELPPFLGHTDIVTCVAFAPDGMLIASGSEDKTIILWDASTGKPVRKPFTGHSSTVNSVAFSPDGKRIVSGSYDNTIHVWSTSSRELEQGSFIGHTSSVTSVAFSPDGKRILSGGSDQTVRIWNATMRAPEQIEQISFTGHNATVGAVAFSPNGRTIASGSHDTTICLWNVSTGVLEQGPFKGHTHYVSSVAFSPDGQRIVSGSWDKTICLWNVSTGELERGPLTGHDDWVLSVAFSLDGKWIVSGSRDSTIRLWDASTGSLERGPFVGHTSDVQSVAFSPDANWLVSGSCDHTICLWNASTGRLQQGPFTGHTNEVASVAFSPDGKWIVSGSRDRTILLWNASTGQIERGPFTGHTDQIASVLFSPDGKRIISGSLDNTIGVWNPFTGEPEYILHAGHALMVLSIAISPDGTQIVSGGDDHTIRVMHAHPTSVAPNNEVSFNDQSVINEDGWICGDQGQLLLWVPPLHRLSLYRPNVPVLIISHNSETRLNMAKFAHGPNWAACHKSSMII